MHALTGADKARFERHLARCPECTREISEFAEATACLAAAAAVPPPAALKERALAAAARARQLPPVTSQAAALWMAPPAATARSAGGIKAIGPLRRPWAPRLALAAAAASMVLAGILGVTARTAQHQLEKDLLRSHEVAAVLTARDATMLDARVTTGGTATVVMSLHERALVFAATGLRALPPSKCYELWLLGPGGDKPAGMLPSPRQGRTGPVIASGLASGDRLALTEEPAGGSPHPSSAIILVLTL